MLQDPEWSQWSDRDLAERCMVSHTFVNRLRHEMNQAKEEKRENTSAPAKPRPCAQKILEQGSDGRRQSRGKVWELSKPQRH